MDSDYSIQFGGYIFGEKRNLRKVYDDYTLEFKRKGDTYTLNGVRNRSGDWVTGAGNNFYPLDSVLPSYEESQRKLRMNFAVEKVKVSNTITKTKIVKTTNTVKTGDTVRVLLFCVLALISGLILLAYGIYTYNKNTKKRRRKGE